MNSTASSSRENTAGFAVVMAVISVAALATWVYILPTVYNTISNVVDIGFDDLERDFSSRAQRHLSPIKQKAKFAFGELEGKPTLIAIGDGRLFLTELIPVDTDKSYRLSVKLRILSANGAVRGARTYAGLATYDADKKIQRSKPGAHRYGVVRRTISSAAGWKVYEGIFDSAGDDTHNQLRSGTQFVRPMILFNFKASTDMQTEIAWMKFEEIRETSSGESKE